MARMQPNGRAEALHFLSAVLVHSLQPSRLARFYRDILGIPLVEERHGDAPAHFGCELGDVHFAIHPWESTAPNGGAVKLAFMVFDLETLVEALEAAGVQVLYPPRQLGADSSITAIRDPDDNEIELTQMGDRWMRHLVEHRASGGDVLVQWQKRNQTSS
jgi:predicted enzyme related to lactoylglutathione lyase